MIIILVRLANATDAHLYDFNQYYSSRLVPRGAFKELMQVGERDENKHKQYGSEYGNEACCRCQTLFRLKVNLRRKLPDQVWKPMKPFISFHIERS